MEVQNCLFSFFDELEKIGQTPNLTPPTVTSSGNASTLGSPPSATMPEPLKAGDTGGVGGAAMPAVKTADVASVLTAILGQTIKHPLQAAYRVNRVGAGIDRHRATVNALEQGYPAGWVPLGMRPRE